MKGADKKSPSQTVQLEEVTNPLSRAVELAQNCLLNKQKADGHFVGELQGDTILESEYILLLAFLGREKEEISLRCAKYILQEQMPDGGWSNYPGGPLEISGSVKAYFALKLTGHDPNSIPMQKAREAILSAGGADRCNSFTRFYLALLGQVPYSACPTVPPEMVLLPRWFYINLYAMSSWTRTIVVPLSIMSAFKPVRNLPQDLGITELFIKKPNSSTPASTYRQPFISWANFFVTCDRIAKGFERWGAQSIRNLAVSRAMTWMRERFKDSDGLGAIFPPMIYTIVALKCLGIADDDEEMIWAHQQLQDLMIQDHETIRLQPCLSPVWDTALALNALSETELDRKNPALLSASNWLLNREVRHPGDWSFTNPGLEPGGWFFEYRNSFYPDTDDTAMVLMAFARLGYSKDSRFRPAVERGVSWLLGMQNNDGGWAAFDRNINREVLTQVPFADHNAMLDPSCPDITARVLEALGLSGYGISNPPVKKAIQFLKKTQELNGSWPGRWGVNYLYGTWQVLVGLKVIGFDMTDAMTRTAVKWLHAKQQENGAWGESCRSYDDPSFAGRGNPTASQTSWALLALVAAGQESSREQIQRGVDYLIASQEDDGNWVEDEFTGTGFPKVFYLKYHLYSLYFPLMALARANKFLTKARGFKGYTHENLGK